MGLAGLAFELGLDVRRRCFEAVIGVDAKAGGQAAARKRVLNVKVGDRGEGDRRQVVRFHGQFTGKLVEHVDCPGFPVSVGQPVGGDGIFHVEGPAAVGRRFNPRLDGALAADVEANIPMLVACVRYDHWPSVEKGPAARQEALRDDWAIRAGRWTIDGGGVATGT